MMPPTVAAKTDGTGAWLRVRPEWTDFSHWLRRKQGCKQQIRDCQNVCIIGYMERSEWRFHDGRSCGVACTGRGCRFHHFKLLYTIFWMNRSPQKQSAGVWAHCFSYGLLAKAAYECHPAEGWKDLIPFIRCIMKKTNGGWVKRCRRRMW